MILNAGVALVFFATVAVLLLPRLRTASVWRATITPLASIIGSGFLISLPLIAADLGVYAIFGIVPLVVIAYAIGNAIRFNIIHGEPLFEGRRFRVIVWLEQASHLALVLAYLISVTYYLTLLAAFLLKAIGITDPLIGKAITTAILFFIGIYGLLRGLHALEDLEEYAVSLKLGIIAALFVGLLWLNLHLFFSGEWQIEANPPHVTWHSVQIILGLLIVVQGFETSRFLRGVYPPKLRVQTMRYAQLLSTAIYLLFFLLATVTIGPRQQATGIAAVISMMAVVAAIIPFMLTAGAVFAQLSAAIADSIGAAGLIHEVSLKKIRRHYAYPLIATIGITLTWSANVFEIITLASKAFALFYAMQCLVAASVAWMGPGIRYRALRVAAYMLLAIVPIAVIAFGIPAESG